MPPRAAFLFLSVNSPWVYALAAALAGAGHPATVISTYDWLTHRRERPAWPPGPVPASLRRERWVQPPGYVGKFADQFAPFLRWKLARARARLTREAPWVVAPFPWFLQTVRDVPDGRLIYYNLDDYVLYNPARAALITGQETALVRRAALTICLSEYQCARLRERVPERAADIRHFPLGVVESYLNPAPENIPAARTVGYVGNLIDRVDWRFVAEVARRLPDVEFPFVGGLGGFNGGGMRLDWEQARDEALALPNVRRVGPVAQHEVAAHYAGFGLNWMPYALDHAFNVASCPTKIMDALASGRPFLSTAVPECRLYPQWIGLVDSPAAAAAAIGRLLADPPAAGHARAQVDFARENTWAHRAATLAEWLEHTENAGS